MFRYCIIMNMITRISSNNENIINKRTIYLCDELNPNPLLSAKEHVRTTTRRHTNNRERPYTDMIISNNKSESYMRSNPNMCKYNYADNYAEDIYLDKKRYNTYSKNNHHQRYSNDSTRTHRPWKAVYRK